MSPTIKAILFDVGGPLDTCVIMDRMIDDQIMSSFRKRGVDISVDEYSDEFIGLCLECTEYLSNRDNKVGKCFKNVFHHLYGIYLVMKNIGCV